MRQKVRRRHRSEAKAQGDPPPIDVISTARQLGAFETGNGLQHGIFGVLVALVAALLWLPLRSFLRSGSKKRR